MGAKMISFHVPTDHRLLSAFGELALRHQHTNHILNNCRLLTDVCTLALLASLGATKPGH